MWLHLTESGYTWHALYYLLQRTPRAYMVLTYFSARARLFTETNLQMSLWIFIINLNLVKPYRCEINVHYCCLHHLKFSKKVNKNNELIELKLLRKVGEILTNKNTKNVLFQEMRQSSNNNLDILLYSVNIRMLRFVNVATDGINLWTIFLSTSRFRYLI